jgi:hypothetical protein
VQQRRYNEKRFVGVSPVVEWMARYPSGHIIGFAGEWSANYVPIYALFGPRLGNDVRYVGPIYSGQVRKYHVAESFEHALRRGRYDVLVVGREHPPDLDRPRVQPSFAHPPEELWAREAGFREVARDNFYVLLVAPARPAAAPATDHPASVDRRPGQAEARTISRSPLRRPLRKYSPYITSAISRVVHP